MQEILWKTMIDKKDNQKKVIYVGPDRFGHYSVINSNDEPLATLADFLITEIRSPLAYTYFIDWLSGKYGQSGSGGDAFNLRTEGQDVAIYLDAYHSVSDDDDDDDADDQYAEAYYKDIPGIVYFQIGRKQLIELIHRWVDIASKENRPENLTITQDEKGNVEIIPHSG